MSTNIQAQCKFIIKITTLCQACRRKPSILQQALKQSDYILSKDLKIKKKIPVEPIRFDRNLLWCTRLESNQRHIASEAIALSN